MIHFLIIENLLRMSYNHSQLDRVLSESSVENCHTDTNIDQLLTIDIVTSDPS